ncbi:MAG: polysialyltransferase family glycosyltransferase [Bacteroidota bacterium]
MSRLRIFVCSANISALYQSVYAHSTFQTGDRDLLVIDALALKPSQQAAIKQAAQLHSEFQLYDFSSTKVEGASAVPSTRKQWTRRLKTRPGFKQVYDFLHQFKLAAEDKEAQQRLTSAIPELTQSWDEVQVFRQPVLHLNRPLEALLPQAVIHHIEHGLGDYLDILKGEKSAYPFLCLFADAFGPFLEKQGKNPAFIQSYVSPEAFRMAAKRFPEIYSQVGAAAQLVTGKAALLCLQSLEEFLVDEAFWPHFFDRCLEKITAPEQVQFLIKPHPRQSPAVLTRIQQYFDQKGLAATFLDSPEFQSLSIEVLFQAWAGKVKYVFSPFSSSVFYLSYLYPDADITYGYSLRSLEGFTQRTPQLYLDRWAEVAPALKEVFGQRVEEV